MKFCSLISPLWWSGDGGVYLDLRGMDRIHGPWSAGAAALCQRAQMECPIWSAGLASSPLSSRLASFLAGQSGPQQLWAVPHGMVPSFLVGFPLGILGRDFREVARLKMLGVRTLGDLQTLPNSLISAIFGSHGNNLILEARGVRTQVGKSNRILPTRVWVASVSFTRPLTSEAGERALRRALAWRAMAWKPATIATGEPLSGRWILTVNWSSGARATVILASPRDETLAAWQDLFDCFWQKLPPHRQGICRLDLHREPLAGTSSLQMELFGDSVGSRPLVRTIARIRQEADPSFASASEALLESWGARWQDRQHRTVDGACSCG